MATVAADTIEFIPDEEIEFIPDPEPIEFIPDEPDQAAIQSDAMRATQQVMGAVELMGAPTRFANDAVREMGRLQQRAQELDLEANAAIQGQGEFASPQVQNIAQGYRAAATQERQRAEEIANRLRAEAPEIVERPKPGAPTGNAAVDRINWMGRGLGQIASTVGLDPLADTLERAGRSPMGLNFQANIGPAAGGAAGAALMTIPGGQGLGMRLLTPLIFETTAPIVGAVTGSLTGGAAQETIQRQAETPEQTAQRHETLAETQREFPLQSMIGQSAANTPFFRPSIRVIGEAMSGNRTAQAMVGSAAAIGGVMGAMPAVVGGQPLSLGQIAQGALENVLLNRPTRLGRAIGLPDPISTQPRTTNAQQISPASAPDGGVLQSQVAPENAPLPTPQGGEGIPPSRQGEPLAQAAPEAARDIDPLQQIRPAIKVGDQTIVGEAGQTHREILDGFIEQNPEAAADALVNFDTKENPNLFVGPEGELNRTQLKAKYGVSDSQGLAELQQKEASAAPVEPATTPEVTEPTSEVSAKVEAQEAVAIAESEPTGIRNAIVNKARQERGMAEREAVGIRTYAQLWDQTKAAIQQDPQAGRRLVEGLKAQVRPLTDSEDALLTFEQTQREAELDAAMEAVNSARTPEESDAAQLRMTEAQNSVFDAYQVGQNAGTANARGLAARRLLINRDFSLAKMMGRYRAEINGGAPLSKNQQDQVIAANQRIKELETRLSNTEDKLAVAEAQNIFTDLKRTARKEASATKRRSVVDFLADQEAKARQRIISRRGRLNVTVDPLNIAGLVDEAIIGAAKIARGVRDFTAWSKEMLEEFGDRIRPQLQALFNRSGQIESENSAILTGQEPAAPVAALDQKAIFDRARQLVNEGATDLAPVMQQITRELQAQDPNVTERQVRDIFSGYGKVTTPSKEADLTQLRELRNLARLTSQLEDAQRGLTPLKSGPQRDKATARVRELQKQVSVAMRKAGLDTADPTTQIASAHQARVTRLKNAIEETQKNIADRKRTERPEPIPWTPEEIVLREQLDELKTRLDDTLNEPDSAMLDRLSKRIADVTLKIQSGDIAPTPRTQGPPTKAVSEAQAELKQLNTELRRLRREKAKEDQPKLTEEEKRLATDKKRIATQIKKLQDRVSANDYAPRKVREPVLDKEKLELQFKLAEEKRKWNEGFLKEKLSRRTATEKARDFTAETINTSRAILTSADVSAPLRQGGFIFLGNPVRGARTLGTMFKALVSEKQAFKVMRDIDSRPNAPLYEASGLYLARDGNDLRAMEEAYASRWAQRIPLVRESQRAYTTFLNKLRADTFDALHAQLGAATPLENKALANYINAATGRGKYGLQSLENSGQLMNTVFFAPRYVASRFQLLAGQPLMQGTNRTRILIAKEYAKYLAGIATVYALGSLAGATIEKDPRSSDFGKLRFGQTRLDPLSGISQVTTLVSRLATGQTKNQKGRIKSLTSGKFGESSRAEVATRFLRTKLSPAIGAIVDLAAGENVVGEKVTPGQVALRSVIPISFQEIEKHMEAQGVPRGTALFILSLFGAGLQTYDTKR